MQGFSQGLDAESGIQGVRQPPGVHTGGFETRPYKSSRLADDEIPAHLCKPLCETQHQVQEAVLDGNVGYVRARLRKELA